MYGLVPKEGMLVEKRSERQAAKEPFLEFLRWWDSLMRAMRARLRREGYRVRPAKTDRGVAQEMANFEMNVRVLKVVGMWAPFMKEFLGEQAKEKRERGHLAMSRLRATTSQEIQFASE